MPDFNDRTDHLDSFTDAYMDAVYLEVLERSNREAEERKAARQAQSALRDTGEANS